MTQDPNDEWLSHALRQAPWRTQTQATSLVLAVVLAVAVIGALYLAQASRTAAAGRRLQAMEQQRQALEQENEQLRAEIAALRSVPRLTGQAESLGYHPAGPNEVEYMLVKNVPPLAAPTPAPVLTTSEIVPTYNETLEGWLAEQLSTFRTEAADFFTTTFGAGEPAVLTAPGDTTATPQPELPAEGTP